GVTCLTSGALLPSPRHAGGVPDTRRNYLGVSNMLPACRERERGGGGCRRVSGGRRRQRRRSRRSGGAGGTGLSVARGRRRILEVAAVPVIARILRVHGVQRLTQIVRCTSGGDTPVILHRLARHRLALDG